MQNIKQILKIEDLSKKDIFLYFLAYTFFTSLVLYFNFSAFTKTIIFVLNYIVISGVLIADNIGIKVRDLEIKDVLYSFGLGIGALMLGGLFINFTLGLLQVDAPLSPVYLLLFFGILNVVLSYRSIVHLDLSLENINFPKISIYAVLPVLIFATSILGVMQLENTNQNYLLLITIFTVVLLFVFNFMRSEEGTTLEYSSLIFFSALSLLLTFSLRSQHVLGWDINEEFLVFTKTLENLKWSMAFLPGLDYNSCISITILPTIIKVLTGIQTDFVFKFFMQVIFALVPVSVFAISKEVLNKKSAYLSAMIFVFNVWFFEQMPGIIRQEIAFVFYSLLIIVLLDQRLNNKLRNILVLSLSLLIVLSHYSTSYILVAILMLNYLFSFIYSFRNGKADARNNLVIVFTILASIFVWQVYITKTGDAFYKLITKNERTGVFQTQTPTQNDDAIAKLKLGRTLTYSDPGFKNMYYDVLIQYVRQQDEKKYSNTEALKYNIKEVDNRAYIQGIFGNKFANIYQVINYINKFFVYILLPLFGFLLFIYDYIKNPFKDNRKFLAISTNLTVLFLLSVLLAFPYLQIHYNTTRLYLQLFVTLTVFTGYIVYRFENNQYIKNAIFVLVVLFMFTQNGFLDQFFGGYRRITLNPEPANDYIYVIREAEIASAKWLKQNIKENDIVQADIISNLRLQSYAQMSAKSTKIFPLTLYKDSFVYLTNSNKNFGIAYYQYKNILYSYTLPTNFLNSHKNLVYSNNKSIIYR